MVDYEAFGKHVEEVLQHLYDYVYLERHALAPLCAEIMPGQASRAQRLRRLMLETIEELSPPPSTPPTFPEWRPYRVLTLRFVEGASLNDVLTELAISERQYYRVQKRAIHGVTDLLWERIERHERARAEAVEERELGGAVSPDETAAPGEEAIANGPGLHDEVGRLTGRTESFSLAELIAAVIGAVAPLALEKGVSIDLEAREALPPVCINRTVGRQLFIALLGALLSQAQEGAIEITLGAEASRVGVSVAARRERDKGGEAATHPDLGTVRYLVESVAGVWQAQEPSPGVFRVAFTLPTALPRTLLSIEDNPAVTRLIERYVTGHGYRVVGTQSGPEALALYGDLDPDVVLLDIMMPGQDGWEVLQQVRARAGEMATPIVVCSVLDQHDLAQTLGASGYLKKPFTQRQLLEALEAVRPEA